MGILGFNIKYLTEVVVAVRRLGGLGDFYAEAADTPSYCLTAALGKEYEVVFY